MIPEAAEAEADSASLYWACQSADSTRQAGAYGRLWAYLYRVALQLTFDQPDGQALAEDCAQSALIRVHGRISECREPRAFRKWARQIVSHLAIDELRRRKRLLPREALDEMDAAYEAGLNAQPLEEEALTAASQLDLRRLLDMAPISERSRRLVIGRYFDDQPDEALAPVESQLAGQLMRPSHLQVTRAKNIHKLRGWALLQAYFADRPAGASGSAERA
jgi:RNA polymerase sigma-70 factor (ECF subfamily)